MVGRRPRRVLSLEEKLAAVRRVKVNGETKAAVARDLDVADSTLKGWVKNEEKISGMAAAAAIGKQLTHIASQSKPITTRTGSFSRESEFQVGPDSWGHQLGIDNSSTFSMYWFYNQQIQNLNRPQDEPLDLSHHSNVTEKSYDFTSTSQKEDEDRMITDETNDEIFEEDGLAHGEKFLHWLSGCNLPCVTLLQVSEVNKIVQNMKQKSMSKAVN
ncbi:unnamed protein product [Ceutorhynchus assimilis]|uniref:HTH psq-type domain-containing protein n=1 Tax=Ceutorhynchus assimilis TaxID=467358 RepID=A0A9N9MKC2_9CUCU|nr:unnamed protein product [Ceutorhynchus assimilis]